MSELRADTITASDGTSPVTLTKQSAAKAWATWNGIGTVALTDSFGTSSILDNTTGDYTLTLSSAMTNDDYSITASSQENRCIGVYYGIGTAVTTTTIRFSVNLTNGSYTPNDPSYAHMMAMGDLT
jgi:hypothetical protein